MNPPPVQDLLIDAAAAIRKALDVINKNAQGIVFVVDPNRKLLGAVTDGDIRRGLLAQISLDAPVSTVMNRSIVSRPVTSRSEEVLALLNERVRHIPLVDDDGRVVDYACLHHLHKTPVLEPLLAGNELAYVTECIKTNWISSQGRFIHEFEHLFAEFSHVPHALAVSNGTVALHLALVTLGIGKGDEVIVPDVTFAACANTVLQTGAMPVLVDIDPETWTLDPARTAAAITPRTKALMPVHLYGHPCDMDPLITLAEKHQLKIIEDCAEAFGSLYKNRPVGSLGDLATFSFYGNKTLTTGEGGMVLFKDTALYERARQLRDHGMDKERRYWHPEAGFNYRMTNLQAAIGVAQMERAAELIDAKRRIAGIYNDLLKNRADIQRPAEKPWAVNSYWLYTVRLLGAAAAQRDRVMEKMLLNGIDTRPIFYPLHVMPPYERLGPPSALSVSSEVSSSGISLPSSVNLTPKDQARIVEALVTILSTQELYRKAEVSAATTHDR